ncbi:MAG TPA: tetratricopeptide repeat protein [Blastocatellia bacterium]|nr:tetratricopeptide repeat protein [Blastocatellia bacterium]
MDNTIYTFGIYRLSLAKSILWRGEDELVIEPQQFDLLVYFLQHREELITKKMLASKIWGGHADQRTVANAVGLLRKLLRINDDGNEYIKTVPKKGYRWAPTIEVIESTEHRGASAMQEVDSSMREPDGGWQGLVFTVGDARPQLELPVSDIVGLRGLDALNLLPEPKRADLYFDLGRQAAANIIGEDQAIWMRFLSAQYDHFADALNFYAKTSSKRELDLVVCLVPFWERFGGWPEATERLRGALARHGEEDSEMKARALGMYAKFAFFLDDYQTTTQVSMEAAAMARRIEDDANLGLALYNLARVAEAEGRHADAKALLKQAIDAARKAKADPITSRIYGMLGMVALGEGNYVAAEDCYMKGVAIFEQAGDLREIAYYYSRLSSVAVGLKDIAKARMRLEKSQDPAYGTPGKQSIALAAFNRGLIEDSAGQYKAALAEFQKAFLLRHEIGEKRGTAKAMEAVAKMAYALGKEKESARIFGAAVGLRQSSLSPMSPMEQGRYAGLIDDLHKKHPKAFDDGKNLVLADVVPII